MEVSLRELFHSLSRFHALHFIAFPWPSLRLEKTRAARKVTPNLRESSVFSVDLRFSELSCALHMLEFSGERANLRKSVVSAKCVFGSLCHPTQASKTVPVDFPLPFLVGPWHRMRRLHDANSCCHPVHSKHSMFSLAFGSVPTTPDPNTSAKVLRYKWELHRDTNWWCIYPPFRNYYAINSSENISRNDYANFVQSSQK